MAEEILIDIKLDDHSNKKRVEDLTASIIELQQENKKLAKENRDLEKTGKTNTVQYIENAKQIEVNKQKISENAAERKNLINVIKQEDGSLKALRARNAELIRQRDQITTRTDAGRKAIAAINKEIDRNNAEIRENVSLLEKQKINIGNYPKLFLDAKNAIVAFIAASGLARLARDVFDITSTFQRLSVVLTNTLGSRSEAQAALKDIQDFASRTPFSVVELTDSFVKLVNQGFKPTIEELENLGDLASSQGKQFDQLTEAIIDAQVGEFERLKEFGIRAKKDGELVTFTFKGIQTQVGFTSSEIQKYILSLGDLQGVSGGMAAISETLGGKMSNLGDNIDALLNSIGSATSGLIGGLLDLANLALGSLNESLNDNVKNLQNESAEIFVLVTAATDLNTPTEVRSKLLSELNSKYPDFLKNLDIETVSNEQLASRLEDVNQQFIRKIALVSAQKELQKVQDEITASILRERDLRKNIADLQRQQAVGQRESTTSAAGAAVGFGGVSQGGSLEDRIAGQQERINEIIKNRAGLQSELVSLTKDLTSALDVFDGASKDYFETQKQAITVEEHKKELSKDEINRLHSIAKAESELTILRLQEQLKRTKSDEERVKTEIAIESERARFLLSNTKLVEEERQLIVERSQATIQSILEKYQNDRQNRENAATTALDDLLLEERIKYAESIDQRVQFELEQEQIRTERLLESQDLLESERQLIIEHSQARINEIVFKGNEDKNKKLLEDEKKAQKKQAEIDKLRTEATIGGLQLVTKERSVARTAGNAIFKQDALKETFVNTRAAAIAAYKALASIPIIGPVLGAAAAGAAIVYGAQQTAAILGVQFARGGMVRRMANGGIARTGGVLRGPLHRDGGIPFTVGGRAGFEAEGGEAIINRRSTKMFRHQLSAINQAGGGAAFAVGGIAGEETRIAANRAESQLDVNRLGDIINSVQTVLVYEDFETKANEINSVQRRATVIE